MVLSLLGLVPCFQVSSQLMTENSHSHSTRRSGYIWSNYDDGTAVIKHQHKMVVFVEIPIVKKGFSSLKYKSSVQIYSQEKRLGKTIDGV